MMQKGTDVAYLGQKTGFIWSFSPGFERFLISWKPEMQNMF